MLEVMSLFSTLSGEYCLSMLLTSSRCLDRNCTDFMLERHLHDCRNDDRGFRSVPMSKPLIVCLNAQVFC
jgi:hypothetical protein